MHTLSTTSHGVTVVTEEIPTVRSVSVGLWLSVGSRDETPRQAGCAHFLEHLLFKGTTSRSARQIAESLDQVGGELNAFTTKEETCFHARVLDADLPLALEVLADMLVDAVNAPDDVEAERDVVLSELDLLHDTPDELVHADLGELLLDDHPLARETLGSLGSVTGMPRDTIHDFYLQYYRPELLTVAVAGNTTHRQVLDLVDAFVGDLGRPGGRRALRTPPSRFGARQLRVRETPTEQAHLALGVPGIPRDDGDRWALRVLDMALGGGMSSRLFQEIRERRGLAYTAFSYLGSYGDAGVFGTYVGTAPGKVDEVLGVLLGQLDHVGEDIGEDEVTRAIGALTGSLVLGLEDTGSRMGRLGHQVAGGQPVVTVDEALDAIAAVDLGDVRRVADRVLGAPRDLAVIGPFGPADHDRFARGLA